MMGALDLKTFSLTAVGEGKTKVRVGIRVTDVSGCNAKRMKRLVYKLTNNTPKLLAIAALDIAIFAIGSATIVLKNSTLLGVVCLSGAWKNCPAIPPFLFPPSPFPDVAWAAGHCPRHWPT
jgi:hypothetical protein